MKIGSLLSSCSQCTRNKSKKRRKLKNTCPTLVICTLPSHFLLIISSWLFVLGNRSIKIEDSSRVGRKIYPTLIKNGSSKPGEAGAELGMGWSTPLS